MDSGSCLISTDKAVEPKTVMGATKALAERVRRGARANRGHLLLPCGSATSSAAAARCSDLPAPDREGGPVTVTHPEVTRFFMTIPEAVQLVIEATGIAEGGDIFVLDMGEPVRIMDLAGRLIELAGGPIAIEIVGIRPGEKLHEELFNVDEEVRPTRYGKIMRATRPPSTRGPERRHRRGRPRSPAAGPSRSPRPCGPPCAAQGSPRRTANEMAPPTVTTPGEP